MKADAAVKRLAALAQDTRLAVFRVLVRAHVPTGEDSGLAAGEIASRLGVQAATLSFHLKELANAGLLQSRREGRSIIYDVEFAAMRDLVDFLLEDCCGGACPAKAPRCCDSESEP